MKDQFSALRAEIPDPTHFQDAVEKIHPARREDAEKNLDSIIAGINPDNEATRSSENYAYDVAWSIKPEVDVIAEATDRINNPLSRAAFVERDGKQVLVGVADLSEVRLRKKAAQADLERNAAKATELAIRAKLGNLTINH